MVLATGRRYSRTLHLVEPLGIDVPLVTASGALVKDPRDHRTLFRAEFGLRVLRRALETIVALRLRPAALRRHLSSRASISTWPARKLVTPGAGASTCD